MAYISAIALPNGKIFDIKAKALDSSVPSDSGAIKVKNTIVSSSAWTKDSGIDLYPWQAKVAVSGVTTDNAPNVIIDWRTEDSDINQMLSEQADTYDGGIILYSSTSPDKDFVIATIVCL